MWKRSNIHLLRRFRYVICAFLVVCLYNFFGIGDYMYAKSFDEFSYPLNVDIRPIVEDVLSGKTPSEDPINHYPYRFLTNSNKCNVERNIDLVIIVKSAIHNFENRMAIRETFGKEYFIPEKTIKTLFFLGKDENITPNAYLTIEKEMQYYNDIIQMDFKDSYFNNTIKTMMSFRWVFKHCSNADFYLFTDDDMYISVTNLLDFAKKQINDPSVTIPQRNATYKHLLAGYVFKSAPQRFRTSKWRVSLEEYPWDSWPPYVTAGAYIVSNKSMKHLYVGSLFVKHFRFDDIYLGIVAKKVGIEPTHCEGFHFYKKKYTKEGYKDVIASHGYGDREELGLVWNEQSLGSMYTKFFRSY